MHGKRRLAWILAAALALAAPALAIDLDGARNQGQVGEQADGYVGIPTGATANAEVTKLVSDVNAKRRERYAEIAARNGTPVDTVAALAGKKLIEGAPSGWWVKPDGSWTKKP